MNNKELLISFSNYAKSRHQMPILDSYIEPLVEDYLREQNLQQTDCYTALELLEQMLKEENEALGKAGFYDTYKREKHANQKYCLAIVQQMIKERQANAV